MLSFIAPLAMATSSGKHLNVELAVKLLGSGRNKPRWV